jgi:THO complex subunit 1
MCGECCSLKAKPPQVDWHPEQLKPLEERVYKLIEGIPSVGEDFARSVRNVLHREVHWLDWKASSCPQFEKEPAPLVRKRKRPAEQEMKLNGASAIASALEVASMPISEIADALEENVPSYQRQVAPYEEAMDPESGIEEEYHPKHDKVYCWRTLRVISSTHLAAFGEPTTGPQDLLEKAVKYVALCGFVA